MSQLGPNQTEVHYADGRIACFSYGVPVCAFIPRDYATQLGYAWHGWIKTSARYSVTTTKHMNHWCKENSVEVPDRFLRGAIAPVVKAG